MRYNPAVYKPLKDSNKNHLIMCVSGLNESENSLFLVWIVTKESQASPGVHQDAVTSDAPPRMGWHWPGDQGGRGKRKWQQSNVSRIPSPNQPPTSRGFENGSLHWADSLGSDGEKPLEVSHLNETFSLLLFSLSRNKGIKSTSYQV